MIEYKSDKCVNEILGQYYDLMDMCNGQCASVIDQMPTNVEGDDEYQGNQTTCALNFL